MVTLILVSIAYVLGSFAATAIMGYIEPEETLLNRAPVIACWPFYLAFLGIMQMVTVCQDAIVDLYTYIHARGALRRRKRIMPRALALPVRRPQCSDAFDPFRRMR